MTFNCLKCTGPVPFRYFVGTRILGAVRYLFNIGTVQYRTVPYGIQYHLSTVRYRTRYHAVRYNGIFGNPQSCHVHNSKFMCCIKGILWACFVYSHLSYIYYCLILIMSMKDNIVYRQGGRATTRS
jgi:hypothetical protein